MRLWLAGLIAAALAASTFPATAKLPVKTLTISSKAKSYEISVAYPQTGQKTIDAEIAAWAKGLAADLRKDATGDAPQYPYSLDLSFDVARNDDAMFVVVFQEEIDTGGAHPNHDIITFNYLMPDGWRVYLPEIYDEEGLAKISAAATADLLHRIGGPDGMSDPDWIKRGAGTDWDHFRDFALLPKTLAIQFPPYQVAAYAAGPQGTTIPVAALRDGTRADWRAPAASFECASAKSALEHGICSDVALARLDRQASEAYLQRLRDENDAGKRDGIRSEQRAWLSRRNGACAGQTGHGLIACLTGVYKERLAAQIATP